MSRKNCSSIYLGDVKLISSLCAAVVTILAIIIIALIIPEDIFMIGEIWGIGIHRYQIIVCGGIAVCSPAYFSVKFFCCRRCCPEPPEPPQKAEEHYGFPYIIDGG